MVSYFPTQSAKPEMLAIDPHSIPMISSFYPHKIAIGHSHETQPLDCRRSPGFVLDIVQDIRGVNDQVPWKTSWEECFEPDE